MFHVLGALTEFERDLIRERTQAGLAAARARVRVGGRPTVCLAGGDQQQPLGAGEGLAQGLRVLEVGGEPCARVRAQGWACIVQPVMTTSRDTAFSSVAAWRSQVATSALETLFLMDTRVPSGTTFAEPVAGPLVRRVACAIT